jgi:hypothetical protein
MRLARFAAPAILTLALLAVLAADAQPVAKTARISLLSTIMKDPPTEAERETLHWQTEKFIAAPPPVKPASQPNLFPDSADEQET